MTTKQAEKRPWTEDEIALVSETMDAPRAEVAARLGRPVTQVTNMRSSVRKGYAGRTVFAWTPEEDAILADPLLSAEAAASKLVGRSAASVNQRRSRLGVKVGQGNAPRNPYGIGNRPLLAKTCSGCGRILPAGWFSFDRSRKIWSARCLECRAAATAAWRINNPEAAAEANRDGANRLDLYSTVVEAVTRRQAARSGMEYTERDYEVLMDPELTIFAKAMRLERTWSAVRTAARAAGFKSHRALGDPATDQWIIDNPNLPRVQEIKAALEAAALEAGDTRPTWDWDD